MKIDAKINWLVDDNSIGIFAGQTENVAIDMDYVEADENDIISDVEYELNEKYGNGIAYNKDFEITNMNELLEEISYSEFKDQVDPGYDA